MQRPASGMSLHPGRLAGGRASRTCALIYREVPKAACSTIGQLLYHADYGNFFTDDIHDAGLDALQWPDPAFDKALGRADRMVFSAVRNPYSRLLACFSHKIIYKRSSVTSQLSNRENCALLAGGQHYGARSETAADSRSDATGPLHGVLVGCVQYAYHGCANRGQGCGVMIATWNPASAKTLAVFHGEADCCSITCSQYEAFANGVAPNLDTDTAPTGRPALLPRFNVDPQTRPAD